jgi:hypothetical protein
MKQTYNHDIMARHRMLPPHAYHPNPSIHAPRRPHIARP